MWNGQAEHIARQQAQSRRAIQEGRARRRKLLANGQQRQQAALVAEIARRPLETHSVEESRVLMYHALGELCPALSEIWQRNAKVEDF